MDIDKNDDRQLEENDSLPHREEERKYIERGREREERERKKRNERERERERILSSS